MSPLEPGRRDLVKCEDMRIYARRARQFLDSRSLDEFLSDELLQDAIIRCVEVIGEAARQVSDSTRRREPEIPWGVIVGMRNILAHDYGGIDLQQVYQVVAEQLPGLLERLDPLIADLESDVGWRGGEDSAGE